MVRIKDSELYKRNDLKDVIEIGQAYNTILQEIADELAPLKKVKMCKSKLQPWFTPRLVEEVNRIR